MDDLLVQPRAVPPIRLKSTKSLPRLTPKTTIRASSQAKPSGAVTKAIRGASNYLLSLRDGLTAEERKERRLREEAQAILSLRMKTSETREQWEAAAQQLDVLEGNDVWKRQDSQGDYNPELIEQRLRDLDAARINGDIRAMMHLIRTALSRDLGGMGNVDLYRHSYVGTKSLIERYVDSTIQTIDAIVSHGCSMDEQQLKAGGYRMLDYTSKTHRDQKYRRLEHRDLLEGMLLSRQSFGRSALLLSGGGTFGMAHIGVLKALFLANLLPRIISGASAGSIVCAVMCTRTDEEMPRLMEQFPYGDLDVFEDGSQPDGVLGHLRRLLTEGSWADIGHLSGVMRGLTGDLTFQEAYNRTRRILNICVSTASVYEMPRLLNYVTAPNVLIWSAVAASCSVPLVFGSSPLLVKDPLTGEHQPWNPSPQRWIDGSVDNDLPMTRLSEMFNVNHFIVSQVNPHVVPFLSRDDHLEPASRPLQESESHDLAADSEKPIFSSTSHEESDWVYTLTALARGEALHRLQFLAEVGIMPNMATKLRSILSQKYSGDINILPDIGIHDLPRLMSNPTTDFMLRMCLAGERATWPKMSRIRDRCAIELALDRAVHQLRARVVFSESQQDLRKLHTGVENLQLPGGVRDVLESGLHVPPVNGHQRQRRRSGGSLQFKPNKRQLENEGENQAKELQDEAHADPRARASQPTSPTSRRGQPLHRVSKSHVHVGEYQGLRLLPVADESAIASPLFDLPKPPPPLIGEGLSINTALRDEQGLYPTDDVETSDVARSSESGADQGTKESDYELGEDGGLRNKA